jgi:MFS family permease
LIGGVTIFTLAMVTDTGNWTTLTILAFIARACMMAGSCSTWVTTAEIYSTEIRTSGHSAANALGRVGAFISPYLVRSNTPITTVGAVMLAINAVTAFSAWYLPETKGVEIGHVTDEDQNSNTSTTSINQASVPPIV